MGDSNFWNEIPKIHVCWKFGNTSAVTENTSLSIRRALLWICGWGDWVRKHPRPEIAHSPSSQCPPAGESETRFSLWMQDCDAGDVDVVCVRVCVCVCVWVFGRFSYKHGLPCSVNLPFAKQRHYRSQQFFKHYFQWNPTLGGNPRWTVELTAMFVMCLPRFRTLCTDELTFHSDPCVHITDRKPKGV